jgi:hypothetical protein
VLLFGKIAFMNKVQNTRFLKIHHFLKHLKLSIFLQKLKKAEGIENFNFLSTYAQRWPGSIFISNKKYKLAVN